MSLDYALAKVIFVTTNSSIVSLDLLIQSPVADWILKQLVIIYSIAPILQTKDQIS